MVLPQFDAFVCKFGFLTFYSKFVTTIRSELVGCILASMFNPVSAVIFRFTCRLLRLVRLISWFVR